MTYEKDKTEVQRIFEEYEKTKPHFSIDTEYKKTLQVHSEEDIKKHREKEFRALQDRLKQQEEKNCKYIFRAINFIEKEKEEEEEEEGDVFPPTIAQKARKARKWLEKNKERLCIITFLSSSMPLAFASDAIDGIELQVPIVLHRQITWNPEETYISVTSSEVPPASTLPPSPQRMRNTSIDRSSTGSYVSTCMMTLDNYRFANFSRVMRTLGSKKSKKKKKETSENAKNVFDISYQSTNSVDDHE